MKMTQKQCNNDLTQPDFTNTSSTTVPITCYDFPQVHGLL